MLFVPSNPPVVSLASDQVTVVWLASLSLWTVAWGLFGAGVLRRVAWPDASLLSSDQVPRGAPRASRHGRSGVMVALGGPVALATIGSSPLAVLGVLAIGDVDHASSHEWETGPAGD